MPRIATDQVAVLDAVKARIVAQCPPLTAATVVITDADEPPEGIRGDLVATLWVTDGRFDEALHEGGGSEQTVEYAGVSVTLWRRNWSDRQGVGADMLREDAIGLLAIKRSVLKALSGHDLEDANGNQLLRNLMAPLTSDSPRKATHQDGGKPTGDVRLIFSTDFDWDLS